MNPLAGQECVWMFMFSFMFFSEIRPELSKLSVPKSVQNSFDAQICRFVFYSAKCGVLTLSCQMHGKIWKLASGPFSLSVSMHNLSLSCLVSLRFNLDFFPLGHLDKNAKTFLDIVKYHQFSAQHIFSCLFCFQMKVVFQHNLRLSCLAISFYDSQIIHAFSLNTIVKNKIDCFGVPFCDSPISLDSQQDLKKISHDKTIDLISTQEKSSSLSFPFYDGKPVDFENTRIGLLWGQVFPFYDSRSSLFRIFTFDDFCPWDKEWKVLQMFFVLETEWCNIACLF